MKGRQAAERGQQKPGQPLAQAREAWQPGAGVWTRTGTQREREAERGKGCQSLEGGRETHSWGWRYIHRDGHTGRDTETLSNGDRPTGTEGAEQEKTRLRDRRDRGKDRDGDRERDG